jgi:hypothetical protein
MGALIVEPFPSLGHYRLREALPFPGGEVPNGFAWNGASIPRATWTVFGYTPFDPILLRASCVHDYLYEQRAGTRRAADDLFRAMLREDGLDEDHTEMMYAAVREYGLNIWTDAEDEIELARRAQAERRRVEDAP